MPLSYYSSVTLPPWSPSPRHVPPFCCLNLSVHPCTCNGTRRVVAPPIWNVLNTKRLCKSKGQECVFEQRPARKSNSRNNNQMVPALKTSGGGVGQIKRCAPRRLFLFFSTKLIYSVLKAEPVIFGPLHVFFSFHLCRKKVMCCVCCFSLRRCDFFFRSFFNFGGCCSLFFDVRCWFTSASTRRQLLTDKGGVSPAPPGPTVLLCAVPTVMTGGPLSHCTLY